MNSMISFRMIRTHSLGVLKSELSSSDKERDACFDGGPPSVDFEAPFSASDDIDRSPIWPYGHSEHVLVLFAPRTFEERR
jgi:hypothetical protein